MTLHQLKIFECVVKHRNITRASVALHISQPSVSQQLKLLEEEFGSKFLIRLNQGVELTPEGEEFFNGIRPLLVEAENLEKRFKNNPKANDTAPLTVGGSRNVSVKTLPRLLMALKERHPSLHFILETDRSPAIEKRLLASEFEIALITNPSHRGDIVYEPYEEMQLVAFCLPTNPLARKKLTLKELVECPLVLRGGGRLERVLMNLGLGYKLNVALRCEASLSVKEAVRMGMGVGILYESAVATRVAQGNLRLINVPELKQMGIQSFIIFDKRKPLAPMAQEFLQILHEKRDSQLGVNDRRVQVVNARSLSVH
jgi:LysR family transcriptional regulator, transcriptional activator of the cysJI operon